MRIPLQGAIHKYLVGNQAYMYKRSEGWITSCFSDEWAALGRMME